MCLVRGVVDRRSGRHPNSKRVPSSTTPNSFRTSLGIVGDHSPHESLSDVNYEIIDSCCWGNTSTKYSTGVRPHP